MYRGAIYFGADPEIAIFPRFVWQVDHSHAVQAETLCVVCVCLFNDVFRDSVLFGTDLLQFVCNCLQEWS